MIPENLQGFPWGIRHFFKGKGAKPKMSLNKNFIVEAMRFYGLSYKILEYQIVPLPLKKEPIVAMKVAVYGKKGNIPAHEVEGFATVGDKSYEEGQSHFGQQVLNRAIAVGVKNWLQISDADVEEIIKTKLAGGKGIRESEDIEPDEPETKPEEQLVDDEAAAKMLGLGG